MRMPPGVLWILRRAVVTHRMTQSLAAMNPMSLTTPTYMSGRKSGLTKARGRPPGILDGKPDGMLDTVVTLGRVLLPLRLGTAILGKVSGLASIPSTTAPGRLSGLGRLRILPNKTTALGKTNGPEALPLRTTTPPIPSMRQSQETNGKPVLKILEMRFLTKAIGEEDLANECPCRLFLLTAG